MGKYINERENETGYGKGGEKETDRKRERERRGKERHREPMNVQYDYPCNMYYFSFEFLRQSFKSNKPKYRILIILLIQ